MQGTTDERHFSGEAQLAQSSQVYLEEVSMNPYASSSSQSNSSSHNLSTAFFNGVENEFRRISDPIHKFIELPKSIWRLVDTPQFQRLRYIKQLGTTQFVFNGANHTRFEHCLGVAHLAWTYLDTIAATHRYDYLQMGLADIHAFHRLKLLVSIAGLCHDLGHGPFSHMFDNMLLPKLGETTWKHEEGSCMMLKALLDEPAAEFYTRFITYNNAVFHPAQDFAILTDMIQGLTWKEWETKYGESWIPKWGFDIISNKSTSIDVDKFDYLKRDPSGMTVTHQFDFEILFRETRIVGGELCYNSKLHDLIYDIFHIRYKLFKQIYLHCVAQGIELMLSEALVLAADVYPFKDIIKDPEEYLYLTDSIVELILANKDPRLMESKKLIKRIQCRQLYRFVGEVVLDYKLSLTDQQIIEGITSHARNQFDGPTAFSEEETASIAVIQSKISYCFGETDPVQSVLFFKSSQPTQARLLATQNSSLLRPQKFGERVVRVFSKVNNLQLICKIKSGFANYTKQQLKKEQKDYEKKDTVTPSKNKLNYSQHSLNSPTEPSIRKQLRQLDEKEKDQHPRLLPPHVSAIHLIQSQILN